VHLSKSRQKIAQRNEDPHQQGDQKMRRFTLSALAAVAVIASVSTVTSSANACSGAISTGLSVFMGSGACQLDDIHKDLGSPLNQFNPMQGGGFQAAGPPPVPQVRFGNVCATNVGAFPGPANPVGMQCFASTPYGMVPGVVM
jgi:hypothetical protein